MLFANSQRPFCHGTAQFVLNQTRQNLAVGVTVPIHVPWNSVQTNTTPFLRIEATLDHRPFKLVNSKFEQAKKNNM